MGTIKGGIHKECLHLVGGRGIAIMRTKSDRGRGFSFKWTPFSGCLRRREAILRIPFKGNFIINFFF